MQEGKESFLNNLNLVGKRTTDFFVEKKKTILKEVKCKNWEINKKAFAPSKS